MDGMFTNCTGLTKLILTSFSTEKVNAMAEMFSGSTGLQTIYVSDAFVTSGLADDLASSEMFYDCTNLVGAVPYDGKTLNATMANAETGYLTIPKDVPVVQYTKGMLTFKYVSELDVTSGLILNEENMERVYSIFNVYSLVIKKVVFEPSFAKARPTSCKQWFYKLDNLKKIQGLQYL